MNLVIIVIFMFAQDGKEEYVIPILTPFKDTFQQISLFHSNNTCGSTRSNALELTKNMKGIVFVASI